MWNDIVDPLDTGVVSEVSPGPATPQSVKSAENYGDKKPKPEAVDATENPLENIYFIA